MMKSICVFCGANTGNDPKFREVAYQLGLELARRNITLVYGGGKAGLMGLVADGVLEGGGCVIGVLPKFLQEQEAAHDRLTQLILCDSMHERKRIMYELSQGFIVLPGGYGTLDEACEMLTWFRLGLHNYPVGFLNINQFYDNLRALLDGMEQKQFLRSRDRQGAIFEDSLPRLLKAMQTAHLKETRKWLSSQSV